MENSSAPTHSQTPESPQPDETKPRSKNWQEYTKKILIFLKEWFFKLKPTYKIIIILLIAVLLVLILLAYLGVFGQEVSSVLRQLVNKILEFVKEQIS